MADKNTQSSPFLRCGCQHQSVLNIGQKGAHCQRSGCIYSSEKSLIDCAGRLVLIPFDVVDTVCKEEKYLHHKDKQFTEYVPRQNSRIVLLLKKLFVRPHRATIYNAQLFLNGLLQRHTQPKILIIGAGSRGVGTDALYHHLACSITGIDIYPSPTVDYIADAHYLPFANETFDGVWIQAVLEHVADPVKVVSEIHRVLRTKGMVYAETPFMQQVHEGAYDFSRFTVLGHRFLFKQFEVLACGGKGGPSLMLAWSVRYWLIGLFRNITVAKWLSMPLFIIAPLVDRLMDRRILFDASTGTFFLGEKIPHTILQASLPALYEGMQK